MPLVWTFPSPHTAVFLWDDHVGDKKHAQMHHHSYLLALRAARAIHVMASKLVESVLLQAVMPNPGL